MPKKEKTIKVRLTDKVNSFNLAGVRYKPGDVFDCPEHHFRSDFMIKVVPPEKKAVEVISEKLASKEENAPEVPTEVPGEIPVEGEDKEEKKRKEKR